MDITTDFLEEEQEKFWKLHQIDEQTMFDKIDMYSAQCMALTLQNDFSKVSPRHLTTKTNRYGKIQWILMQLH